MMRLAHAGTRRVMFPDGEIGRELALQPQSIDASFPTCGLLGIMLPTMGHKVKQRVIFAAGRDHDQLAPD